MSLGYAERLSHREDLGGRLGDPELFEAPHVILDKSLQLAALIRDASKMIVFTGAGISTAAGIPDFRGPSGVWTLQRKGLPLPKLQTSFVYAKPSLTHQALLGLMHSRKLNYICSQNVDGLHLRSGVPREQLAELHGDCFTERCKKCKTEYVRDFEMDTVGFKQTGRHCTRPGCNGMLVDHILDWEDALPPAELKATQQHASAADLAVCLGTSLQIIPAANLPLRTVKAGGKLAIINLQATPKDKKAQVVIHAKVDEVMAVIMQHVGIPIPMFTRTDRVMLSHTVTWKADKQQPASAAELGSDSEQVVEALHEGSSDGTAQGTGAAAVTPNPTAAEGAGACVGEPPAAALTPGSSSAGSWSFTLCVSSIHGNNCPLPMVASASVKFTGAAGEAGLKPRELTGQLPWKFSRSCPAALQEVTVEVTLRLVEAADADKRSHVVQYIVSKPPQQPDSRDSRAKATRRSTSQPAVPSTGQVFSFVTQQLDYTDKQQQLIKQLQAAAQESRLAAPVNPAAEATAAAKPRKRSVNTSRSKCTGASSALQHDGSGALLPPPSRDGGGRGGSCGVDKAGQRKSEAGAAGQGVAAEGTSQPEGARPQPNNKQGSTNSSREESADGESSDDASGHSADSLDSGAEPTGHDGQNTTGRSRKRAKRFTL